MAVSLKHKFASAVADISPNPDGLILPSNWNDEHDLLIATATLVGRTTAGTGSAEEIAVSSDLTLTAGTLGVAASLSGKTLVDPTIDGTIIEDVFTITDGASVDIDPSNGSVQLWTLGANRTPGQANWAAGQAITLMVDDGTARTITWTTLAVVWETNGGVAPTLDLTGFTVIVLWKVGTTIYGARVGDA